MYSYFNRFQIRISKSDALYGCQQGQCDSYINDLFPKYRKQLEKLPNISEELKEYGAWNSEELLDQEANQKRILWLACCDIKERIKND